MGRLRLRRGTHSNLPTDNMLEGEPLFSTDRATLHVATGTDTKLPLVPAVDELDAIGAIDGAADFFIIHDASASGVKEKRVTPDAVKTAFNIPEESTDERVAVVSGGTSGFVWGTDGTDGIFRMGAGMTWTKDGGNAFVTLAVDVVDGGTFT
jgi:hypothetical protein